MEQKRPADIFAEALDFLWSGLGLEEKGWKRLKKGDFKKKMKNGLTYQIWFDRSRYNYIDYEIGHGNVEVGFSCIIKQGDDYLYNRRGGGMMEYREVYFRIRSSYRYDSGWPDKGVEHAFRDETRTLFQSAGWELHPAREDSSSSDIVTKGQQDLYLHPMNFSGVIQTDEIPRLQELLEGAQTFQCQGVDCYERYWELTDAEYLKQLEARRDEIIEAILERYQTKRKNLYVTGPAELSIAKQFSVHRLCDKDGKNNLANRYVGELVERLIREGRLVTAETRNGLGIRTAAGEELRQREEPLPGQQQMTL